MNTPFIDKINLLNRTILTSFGTTEKEVIEKFVEASVIALEADYGFSWFRELDDLDFRWLYKTKNTPYAPSQPRKKGVMSKVFNTQEPLLIEQTKRSGFVREDARDHMKSVAVIPVVYQNHIYGTIVICYKQPHKFKSFEHDLCIFIGNGAAQAITISRLNSNLQRAKDTLEMKVKERTRELTEANALLKKSESRLLEAQGIAHIGNWEFDTKTEAFVWSKEMYSIYEIPVAKKVAFKDAIKCEHPSTRKKTDSHITQARRKGGSFEFYHKIQTSTGKVKALLTKGQAITDGQNKIIQIVGTSQDVTQQWEAEEILKAHAIQLEESQKRVEQERAGLDTLFQNMGEGVMATDKNGKISAINALARQLLNLNHSQVIGDDLFKTTLLLDAKGNPVPEKERPIYKALYAGKTFATSGLSSAYYYKNGNKISAPLGITATPVKIDGEVVGAIELIRDVSKEYEIDKVKSELISLASHQLRTPLSAINWFSETLLKEEVGKINKEQKKYLQEIFNANQKMVELVYDFLNVSRLELGTFTLKPINLSLAEVANGVINELQPTITKKHQKLTIKIAKTPKVVHADRKLVRIVIQNLLSNAVKYTPDQGRVSLNISYRQTHKDKLEAKIIVSDTGIGIPKSQEEYIYSKLFRADNIKKLDTEGTGLGLYILKSFVDYCGGKTWFKSSENKGTTFYVTMPMEKEKKV